MLSHKHKQLVPACSSNALNVWQKLWDGGIEAAKRSMRKIWPSEGRSVNVVANYGRAGVLTVRAKGTMRSAFALRCTPAVGKMLPESSVIAGFVTSISSLCRHVLQMH